MIARMVISLKSSGRVAITAMGAYKDKKMLVMKTMADSPGRPMTVNAGVKKVAIQAIIPK
jgi:hypothetical protein